MDNNYDNYLLREPKWQTKIRKLVGKPKSFVDSAIGHKYLDEMPDGFASFKYDENQIITDVFFCDPLKINERKNLLIVSKNCLLDKSIFEANHPARQERNIIAKAIKQNDHSDVFGFFAFFVFSVSFTAFLYFQ